MVKMIMLLPTARNRPLCCHWLLPQKQPETKLLEIFRGFDRRLGPPQRKFPFRPEGLLSFRCLKQRKAKELVQRDTCMHGILNTLLCLPWYSLNSLNTGAKEVGLASKAGGPETKEEPFSDPLQKNVLRFAPTRLCTKHLCDHIESVLLNLQPF